MKRKLLFVMSAVMVAVVCLGPPAGAKGIGYANFTGPGLPPSGVTILRGDEEKLWQTGLVAPKIRWLSAYGLSRSDLGPAYKARYRMDYAPNKTLHQVIYPFAKSGPVTFTPRGQHIGQDYESFRGGWFAAPSDLLAFLAKYGFPANAPGTETSEKEAPVRAAGVPSAGSGGGWPIWGWALVAMGLAAATLLAALQFRRRALTR